MPEDLLLLLPPLPLPAPSMPVLLPPVLPMPDEADARCEEEEAPPDFGLFGHKSASVG